MDYKTKRKFIGNVVLVDGKYYFRTKHGSLFNIVQDQNTKDLYTSQDLAILELVPTKNPNERYGIIIETLGKTGNIKTEGLAIVNAYDLNKETTPEALKEINDTPTEVSSKEISQVRDLRHIPFVTIDPDNAGDYDDAVYAVKNSDGSFTLMVAIANVAHYVKPHSALFKHAMTRGNSTYLANSELVFPMLDKKLSNGICSLVEGQDRLVMCTTCIVEPDGRLRNYTIEPAVINSRHRLTYKEADFLFLGKNHKSDTVDHSDLIERTKDIGNSLNDLSEVTQILYKARMARGAFDINTGEVVFYLDPTGTRTTGYGKEHDEYFTGVIEETAILTNEIWGEVAYRSGLPFSYRNHKSIDKTKIPELRDKFAQFEIKVPRCTNNKGLQKIINFVKGKRIEEYVVSNILKSMESAFYSTDNIGHAGLAINPDSAYTSYSERLSFLKDKESLFDDARASYFRRIGKHNGLYFEGDISHMAYAQVTSPIRRGSDYIDQTQMLEIINNGHAVFGKEEIEEYCSHFNFTESNSQNAECDYDDMLSADWAMQNIGRTFNNCTVVDLGDKEAKILTDDGLHMWMPYTGLGIKRKYLKIGRKIDGVTIAHVALNPAKIICSSGLKMQINSSEEVELSK